MYIDKYRIGIAHSLEPTKLPPIVLRITRIGRSLDLNREKIVGCSTMMNDNVWNQDRRVTANAFRLSILLTMLNKRPPVVFRINVPTSKGRRKQPGQMTRDRPF